MKRKHRLGNKAAEFGFKCDEKYKVGGGQVGRKRNSKRTRCTYPEKGLGLFGLFRLAPGELSPGENPVKVTLDQAPVLSCHSLPGTQLGSLAASWWPKPHALQMRFLPPAEPPPPTALATPATWLHSCLRAPFEPPASSGLLAPSLSAPASSLSEHIVSFTFLHLSVSGLCPLTRHQRCVSGVWALGASRSPECTRRLSTVP